MNLRLADRRPAAFCTQRRCSKFDWQTAARMIVQDWMIATRTQVSLCRLCSALFLLLCHRSQSQ
jgi:hypothetical protein